MQIKRGFIYIFTNSYNTVLYIGVTSNLIKRVWEHKNNIIDGFTKKYHLHKLVYFEVFNNIEEAIKREKYLKGKSRTYKKELIQKINPKYKDLYNDIL